MEYCSHFPCGSVDWNLWEAELRFQILPSLPLRKCGLKCSRPPTISPSSSHFPCGSVDWNPGYSRSDPWCPGHFPCGSVDWNCFPVFSSIIGLPVTSLAEVWIEIENKTLVEYTAMVTSLAEVWIEIEIIFCLIAETFGHFPCGSVDWNDSVNDLLCGFRASLPLRKCGLKSPYFLYRNCPCGHFPCGSVDWNLKQC